MTVAVKKVHCPECGSVKLVKNGFGFARRRRVQRYRCNSCLRNTVKPRRS